MDPVIVTAHYTKMRQIQAQESLLEITRLMFAYPPQSQEDVDYRTAVLSDWEMAAQGKYAPNEDDGDYRRVGNTIYVKTAEALRRALGEVSVTRRDRIRLGVEGETDE